MIRGRGTLIHLKICRRIRISTRCRLGSCRDSIQDNIVSLPNVPSDLWPYTLPLPYTTYCLPLLTPALPTELRFFPKELWSTIDPSRAPSKSSRTNPRPQKRARLADGDADGDAELPADDDPTKAAADDDDPDRAADEEPGDPEDDFSEDDSEMGADYNAENYFDGGDDDAGSDNGGGGGDGGDYD